MDKTNFRIATQLEPYFFYQCIERMCNPFWISYTSSIILEMSYLGANIGASNFF